jgi:hypothetical protein
MHNLREQNSIISSMKSNKKGAKWSSKTL